MSDDRLGSKVTEHYERFLKFWEGADPCLFEVENVK